MCVDNIQSTFVVAGALLILFASQHMQWMFPTKDMTQSGDEVQGKAEQVLTIDLRHYANQHRQRIILNNDPEQQTFTTEKGFSALFGSFGEFPNASCDPMSWLVQ